jgi:hypothetical protein
MLCFRFERENRRISRCSKALRGIFIEDQAQFAVTYNP